MRLHDRLKNAMSRSLRVQPQIGSFPYLAECLRLEGFSKNTWYLPSGDSFYFSKEDSLVIPGKSLIEQVSSCPSFSKEKLIKALRADQVGQTTFEEFLMETWKSGIVKYEVNFIEREVIYFGANGEEYKEAYPEVTINE
ncbi:DUF1398 family protein [Enterococcus entomosocium]|jgi:uncharacterized protein YbcV (DUF1398 family)|uniref:DUF1398 family protein n=1 Tax=Enterococcus entomosocium TaxID=3034352 RepID=A0ABV3MDU7_9ENTE|nr:DUF1398 family protein [Enterococcus casseliflavus]MDF2534735.1 hypothetical protein [Bacillales bacterium]